MKKRFLLLCNISLWKSLLDISLLIWQETRLIDNISYEEALAKYQYDDYLYDMKKKKIDKALKKIEQEDRGLELKLKQLDTRRTQITTELEAVQKVLKDNIEKSYKTFSG